MKLRLFHLFALLQLLVSVASHSRYVAGDLLAEPPNDVVRLSRDLRAKSPKSPKSGTKAPGTKAPKSSKSPTATAGHRMYDASHMDPSAYTTRSASGASALCSPATSLFVVGMLAFSQMIAKALF